MTLNVAGLEDDVADLVTPHGVVWSTPAYSATHTLDALLPENVQVIVAVVPVSGARKYQISVVTPTLDEPVTCWLISLVRE